MTNATRQVAEHMIATVKEAVKRKYGSQRALGRKVNISQSVVSRFCRGFPVERDFFTTLAKALGLDPDKLDGSTKMPTNLRQDRINDFVGREKQLNQLHNLLVKDDGAAKVAIVGMGGVGKTELALQYAYRQFKENTYSGGICWINAREKNIGSEIENFAQSKTITKKYSSDSKNIQLKDKVKWCYDNWNFGDQLVLIVLDDVTSYESIEDYLPPSQEKRFKVLMTSRFQNFASSIEPFPLDEFDEITSLKFLDKITKKSSSTEKEQEEKISLCKLLGYLPLALQLVGQRIGQGKETYSRILEQFDKKKLKAIALSTVAKGMTAKLAVEATLSLTWDEDEFDDRTKKFACFLSLFALADIPWSLVEKCYPEEEHDTLEIILENKLFDYSFLKRINAEDRTFKYHQLIREFLREKFELLAKTEQDDLKRKFCDLMVAEACKINYTMTRKQIEEIESSIPHLAELATVHTNLVTDKDFCLTFTKLSYFYHSKGNYSDQEAWLIELLSISKSRLGEEHAYVADTLNNLASFYESQGRYSEAESLYLLSLKMRDRLLREEHSDVAYNLKSFAASLNNLAGLCKTQGMYDAAESFYLLSLNVNKKLPGEGDLDVAYSLNNLALLYHSQGRYDEVEPLFRQSLDIRKKLLGEEHPDVATILNNLAEFYKSQGRYDEAEPRYLQALEITKKLLLGKKHPFVTLIQENLNSTRKASKNRKNHCDS